jgi:hypothetical protein
MTDDTCMCKLEIRGDACAPAINTCTWHACAARGAEVIRTRRGQ